MQRLARYRRVEEDAGEHGVKTIFEGIDRVLEGSNPGPPLKDLLSQGLVGRRGEKGREREREREQEER